MKSSWKFAWIPNWASIILRFELSEKIHSNPQVAIYRHERSISILSESVWVEIVHFEREDILAVMERMGKTHVSIVLELAFSNGLFCTLLVGFKWRWVKIAIAYSVVWYINQIRLIAYFKPKSLQIFISWESAKTRVNISSLLLETNKNDHLFFALI